MLFSCFFSESTEHYRSQPLPSWVFLVLSFEVLRVVYSQIGFLETVEPYFHEALHANCQIEMISLKLE